MRGSMVTSNGSTFLPYKGVCFTYWLQVKSLVVNFIPETCPKEHLGCHLCGGSIFEQLWVAADRPDNMT